MKNIKFQAATLLSAAALLVFASEAMAQVPTLAANESLVYQCAISSFANAQNTSFSIARLSTSQAPITTAETCAAACITYLTTPQTWATTYAQAVQNGTPINRFSCSFGVQIATKSAQGTTVRWNAGSPVSRTLTVSITAQ